MKLTGALLIFASVGLLQACSPTPQQQSQVGCIGATIAGLAVGGALGNQLGGGAGNDILTAGGAVAGGLTGKQIAGC